MLLSKPSRDDAALAQVIRYAGKRVCSRSEVLAYLHRRGLPPQTAARALKAAAALNVVDDRACARLCCNHWARLGFAASAIEEKLALKSVDAGAVRIALLELKKEESDRKRAQRWINAQKNRTPKQLARSLAARGYDETVIEELIVYTHEEL